MATVPWLIENGLEHLSPQLGEFGREQPESVVRKTLEVCWADAKKNGAAPEKLFRHIVLSKGESILRRLLVNQDDGRKISDADYRQKLHEYRAAMQLMDPADLEAAWCWVDDRTRFADGRKLSEAEPDPLGSELNVWSVGRMIFLYGEEEVVKWGKQLQRRSSMDIGQCFELLRDKLNMPELGAQLDGNITKREEVVPQVPGPSVQG